MADLGSHGISLLTAFFNKKLRILNALQGGGFKDVPEDSDLFSSLSLVDPVSKAVGTMSANLPRIKTKIRKMKNERKEFEQSYNR